MDTTTPSYCKRVTKEEMIENSKKLTATSLKNLYQIRKQLPTPKVVTINNYSTEDSSDTDDDYENYDKNNTEDSSFLIKISKLEKRNRRLVNDYNDLERKKYYSDLEFTNQLITKDEEIDKLSLENYNLIKKNKKYFKCILYSTCINILLVYLYYI
jgi:hypothetical protein